MRSLGGSCRGYTGEERRKKGNREGKIGLEWCKGGLVAIEYVDGWRVDV